MKKIINDDEFVEISYETELMLGKILWKKKPTLEVYQNAFNTVIDYSDNKQQVENFLSDTRNQGIVSPEYRKWLETVALPMAVEKGLKRTAVVFDGSTFKKYYLNMILKVINKFGTPMKLFGTEEEALEWIKSF